MSKKERKTSKLSTSNHCRSKQEQKHASAKENSMAELQINEKVVPKQEKKAIELKLKKQQDSMEHNHHVLSVLTLDS